MVSLLRFVLTLVEWAIQLKRRDEYEKRQTRLHEARNDPAAYLRQFGRVQRVESNKSDNPVRSNEASTDKHDGQ